MTITDPKQVQSILLETSFANDYMPRSRQDFGGPNTHRKNLRKVGKNIFEYTDGDFGVYLGNHGNNYCVGIKDFITWNVIAIECYPELEELKQIWELD
jgi:hypothetical protein